MAEAEAEGATARQLAERLGAAVTVVKKQGICLEEDRESGVCVLPSILQGSSGHPPRRLGYVSPAPQAIPKDLVIIHLRGSTWDLG